MELINRAVDGLQGYEVILLLMGIALFVVLLFLLARSRTSEQPIKQLIPLFLIAVVMVGFPSISKIGFESEIGKLEVAIKEKDPEKAPKALAQIDKRQAIVSDSAHRTVAKARLLLQEQGHVEKKTIDPRTLTPGDRRTNPVNRSIDPKVLAPLDRRTESR